MARFCYRMLLGFSAFSMLFALTKCVERKPILLRRLRPHYTIIPEETPEFSPCKFYGNPIPYVIWNREGQRLSSTPTAGPYYTFEGALVLKNASSKDSGNYTCKGVNREGSTCASTEITIKQSSSNNSSGEKTVGLAFLYAILAWMLLSAAIATYMCVCGRRHHSHYHRKAGGLNSQPSGSASRDQPPIPQGILCEHQPPEWEPQTENLRLIELTPDSIEWSTIVQLSKKTLSTANVIKVERIQNKWLWRKYTSQKEALGLKNKGMTNEKMLFHGTRGNDPSLIYNGENGFDMRMSNNGMWGQANYFAVNSSYSDSYAYVKGNTRQMFIVKVLTGDSCELPADSKLRMPPRKPRLQPNQGTQSNSGSLRFEVKNYDTVCGTTGGSQVYMTYDNEKAYPAYLIHYTK